MIAEDRRRAYLQAMQVDSWLPRVALPHAAASNQALLAWLPPARVTTETPDVMPEPQAARRVPEPVPAERHEPVESRSQALREALKPAPVDAQPAAVEMLPSPAVPTVASVPPHFALQLLRAGNCLLLVELPTGEGFQSRDPAYLLLRDLLRAAGLPDSPQLIGEPVRWPLLMRGQLDQGPEAAREFVQSFVAARLEEQHSCACLWLVGAPALRFAGELNVEAVNREVQIEGLGAAWTLPGLELLIDEPQRKRDLWQSMRRVMRRWQVLH